MPTHPTPAQVGADDVVDVLLQHLQVRVLAAVVVGRPAVGMTPRAPADDGSHVGGRGHRRVAAHKLGK